MKPWNQHHNQGNPWHQFFVVLLTIATLMTATAPVLADSIQEEVIVSLGHDLTKEQRKEILKRLNASEDDPIVEVTNEEEHKYLGKYVEEKNIGTRALSSAKVTLTQPGSGLDVTTSEHIFYITPEMYKQALATAGVTDARVHVDGPGRVSGTAALTGILKAYEQADGSVIGEERKDVANEELIVTSSLGESIGNEKATELFQKVKETMAQKSPKSREEVQQIIIQIAGDINVNLTENQTEQITNFFDRLRTLDIDWQGISERIQGAAHEAKDYLGTEEGQGLIRKIQSGVNSFFNWFADLFAKEKGGE